MIAHRASVGCECESSGFLSMLAESQAPRRKRVDKKINNTNVRGVYMRYREGQAVSPRMTEQRVKQGQIVWTGCVKEA